MDSTFTDPATAIVTGLTDTSYVVSGRTLLESTNYFWAVQAIDSDSLLTFGKSGQDSVLQFIVRRVTTLVQDFNRDEKRDAPKEFKLYQNYPNPGNPSTVIRYQLAEGCNVRLTVYNTLGQKVRTLVDDVQPAGFYAVTWDGTDESGWRVASGIYLYSIQAGEFRAVKKALLLR